MKGFIRAIAFAAVGLSTLGLIASTATPALAASHSTAPQSAERAQTIVVGAVSKDPKSRLPRLEALATYLAERLVDVGIRHSTALVASSNTEMVRMLRAGAVDLVSETSFSGMHFAETGSAEFLLREWKKGVAEYSSVFVARRDSGITSLDDLRGRKIAFEDRGSTSGFLLPLALLKSRGLDATEVGPHGKAKPGRVGYAFAVEEVNIAAWVARGVADVGAFSTQDWEDIKRTPAPFKTELTIIHESEPLMRAAVLARSSLRPQLKAGIKQILLHMHEDEAGRDALNRYNKVTKYDEIVGEAAHGLDLARRLYPLVKEEAR